MSRVLHLDSVMGMQYMQFQPSYEVIESQSARSETNHIHKVKWICYPATDTLRGCVKDYVWTQFSGRWKQIKKNLSVQSLKCWSQ